MHTDWLKSVQNCNRKLIGQIRMQKV